MHDNLKIIFASPSNLRCNTEKIGLEKMLFYYPWGAYTERHNAFAMKLQKIIIKLTLEALEL